MQLTFEMVKMEYSKTLPTSIPQTLQDLFAFLMPLMSYLVYFEFLKFYFFPSEGWEDLLMFTGLLTSVVNVFHKNDTLHVWRMR